MYAWIEVHYRTAEHSTIPQYHHEFVPLASLSVYGSWTEEEKKAEYARLRDEKREEFEQKYSELKDSVL